MNTPLDTLAARLFAPGRSPPVAAREDALKRVRYGLFALTETPAGDVLTASDRLADDPAFQLSPHRRGARRLLTRMTAGWPGPIC